MQNDTWYKNTQHNDTHPYGAQSNETQHSKTQHNDKQHTFSQPSETQFNNNKKFNTHLKIKNMTL
jgi:hypothetical protein